LIGELESGFHRFKQITPFKKYEDEIDPEIVIFPFVAIYDVQYVGRGFQEF